MSFFKQAEGDVTCRAENKKNVPMNDNIRGLPGFQTRRYYTVGLCFTKLTSIFKYLLAETVYYIENDVKSCWCNSVF